MTFRKFHVLIFIGCSYSSLAQTKESQISPHSYFIESDSVLSALRERQDKRIANFSNARSQALAPAPAHILTSSGYSPYLRTYKEYLDLWRTYIQSPQFPDKTKIDFQMDRLRLYEDLRNSAPTSNYVLTSENEKIAFWQTPDIDGVEPPSNTYPTCSNDDDDFDLRYIRFTSANYGGLSNKDKKVIWLHVQMHGAHELSNPMALLSFVQNLFSDLNDPWTKQVLERCIFVVFPSVNVGSGFSDPECRSWSYFNSNDVDLLYNFGYDFRGANDIYTTLWNSNSHPTDNGGRKHGGIVRPFSEPESRIIRNIVTNMCHPVYGEGYKMGGMIDWHNNGLDFLWIDDNVAVDGGSPVYNGVVPDFAVNFAHQWDQFKFLLEQAIHQNWSKYKIVKDANSPTTKQWRTLKGTGIVIDKLDTITPEKPKRIWFKEGESRTFAYGSDNSYVLLNIDNEYFDFVLTSLDSPFVDLTKRAQRSTIAKDHSANAEVSYTGFPMRTYRTIKFPHYKTLSTDWFALLFGVNSAYLEPPRFWRDGIKPNEPKSNTEHMYIFFNYGMVYYIEAMLGDQIVNTPPKLGADISITVAEDDTLNFPLTVNDADLSFGDTVTLQLTNPHWIGLNENEQKLTGIPRGDNVGTDTLAVTASDLKGETTTQKITYTVTHTNHDPNFVSKPNLQATEGVIYQFQATAKDRDTRLFGDTIRYRGINLPIWLTLSETTGLLLGYPSGEHVRDTEIVIEAFDQFGGVSRLTYTLEMIPVSFKTIVYPNPFDASVQITLNLPTDSHVDIKILSSTGQLVKFLHSETLEVGSYDFSWVPTTTDNVKPGVYLLSIAAQAMGTGTIVSETKKLVFLK